MAHLALKRIHGLESDRPARSEYLGDRLLGDLGELSPTSGTVTVDIEHEP